MAAHTSLRRLLIAYYTGQLWLIHSYQQFLEISTRTIRRRLSTKFGLTARRPAKKPLLSAKNRKDRPAFCHKFRQWTAEDWSKVLFSDETTARLFSNVGAQMVRRPKGVRYNPRYCQPTVKHSLSVMMCGSMSATGRGNLWFLPPKTTMTAVNYREVLMERLQSMMTVRQTSVFMHDGAPCIKQSW